MKVGPQALAATLPPRDHGKAAKAEKPEKPEKVDKAESGGLPPGLVRVQAKLQDIAAAERTQGQSNALDRISRNLARYAQNQGMATPTTTPTEPTPVTDASTGTTPTPADPVAATPTSTPGTDPLPGEELASGEATPPPEPAVTLTNEITAQVPTTPTVTELLAEITTADNSAPTNT